MMDGITYAGVIS